MLFVLQYQRNKEDTKAEESLTSSSFQSLQFHSKINLGFQIHLLFVFFPIINFVSIIHFFNMSANPLFKKKPQKIEDLPKEKFPLIVFRSFKGCQALCSSASKKIKKNIIQHHLSSHFNFIQKSIQNSCFHYLFVVLCLNYSFLCHVHQSIA